MKELAEKKRLAEDAAATRNWKRWGTPYEGLRAENRRRGSTEAEYEIEDTAVFDGGRFFDVMVEYAKEASDDILIRLTVHKRSCLRMVSYRWSA